MSQTIDKNLCLCEDDEEICCCEKNCCEKCCGVADCCKNGQCNKIGGCCATGSCHIEALKKNGKAKCDAMDCIKCFETK